MSIVYFDLVFWQMSFYFKLLLLVIRDNILPAGTSPLNAISVYLVRLLRDLHIY